MDKTELLIVVGARLNSSRLPGKHLLPLSGRPMIQHLINRLKMVSVPNRIVVATTNDSYNKPLVDLASTLGVEVFAYEGDINDLVGRVHCVFSQSRPAYIAYICGDCPLVEPEFIDRAVNAMKAAGKPFLSPVNNESLIHEGINIYKSTGWQRLVDACKDNADREHVGLSLRHCNIPKSDYCSFKDQSIYYSVKHRISVDTLSDYQLMKTLYENWYKNHPQNSIVSLKWVIEQLKSDSDLRAINANVKQKSPFSSYQKLVIISECSREKGMGQLTRCLRVTRELQERHGLNVELWVLGTDINHPQLAQLNFTSFADEDSLLKALETQSGEAVLLDVFPSRLNSVEEWNQVLQKRQLNRSITFGLDQTSTWKDYLTKVYIPSFYCAETSLNLNFGWECYLIDTIRRAPVKNRLLIMTGSADTLKYGSWLPQWLDDNLPDFVNPFWLVGPYAQEPCLPVHTRLKWEVLHQPQDVNLLLSKAHWVLSVYGVGLFEALGADIPAIALPSMPIIAESEWNAFREADVALCFEKNKTTRCDLHSFLKHNKDFDSNRKAISAVMRKGVANICADMVSELKRLLHSPGQ